MKDCHDTQKVSVLSGVWFLLGDQIPGPLWDMLPHGSVVLKVKSHLCFLVLEKTRASCRPAVSMCLNNSSVSALCYYKPHLAGRTLVQMVRSDLEGGPSSFVQVLTCPVERWGRGSLLT